MSTTIQDLKMQVRQLANIQHHSKGRCQLLLILSQKPTHRCLNRLDLSHCRFQPGLSQQGSLNLMKRVVCTQEEEDEGRGGIGTNSVSELEMMTPLLDHNKHCQRSVETPKFSFSYALLVIVPLLMPCWT
ncbi:hypothetical protein CR513_00786, partial [Mucuna pruriens]